MRNEYLNKMKFLNIFKVLFGISLLGFILYKIGIVSILETLKKTNFMIIVPAMVFCYCLFFILGTINLKILLDPIKRLTLKKLFLYHLVSWSFGLMLPSKIGEFSLIFLLKKEDVKIGQSTAISVIDKSITLITFVILAIIGFFVFFKGKERWVLIIIALSILFLLGILLFSKTIRNIIKRLIGKKREYFAGFSKTLFSYLKYNKQVIVWNIILTLIKWVMISSSLMFFYFLAYGEVVNPFFIVLITSILLIVGLIPITYDGIGLKTPAAVVLFAKLGIGSAVVASVFIIDLISKYLVAYLIFLFLFDKKKLFQEN